ncbi:unnamed protein product [Cunninghamella echinulata]
MLLSIALPLIRSNRCIIGFPKPQITTTRLLAYKKIQQSTRSFYGSIYKQREHHLNNSDINVNNSNNKERNEKEEPKAEVLNPKHQLFIGFTCKVCEIRSHYVMSKQAYTKGVVLIQCPECKNRHLIADNLGWFRDETNVEDLVKEKGEAIRKIIVDDQGQKLPVEHLMEWIPEEEAKIKQADEKKSSSLKNDKEN